MPQVEETKTITLNADTSLESDGPLDENIIGGPIPPTYEELQKAYMQERKYRESLQLRKEGIGTITACLQQSTEENKRLKAQLSTFEQVVAVYQSRLQSLGASTDTNMAHGEVYFAGQSKELQDSMGRENLRLKQMLAKVQADPKLFERLQLDLLSARRDNALLQQKLKENTSPQELTEDQKNQEIFRLRKQLEEVSVAHENKDIMCTSLSKESTELKHRLNGLASTCQSMAKKLEEKQSASDMAQQMSMEKLSMSSSGPDSSLGEKCAILRVDNSTLRTEVEKLEARTKELLEANSKWQNYDKQREEYIARLHATIEELQNKAASNDRPPASLSPEQQQHFDRVIVTWKEKVKHVEEEKAKIEDENRQLRVKCQQLDGAVNSLQSQVTRLTTSAPAGGQRAEDRDRIQILEAQIQICTEDFQSERADREKAQARVAELEQEVELIRRQLDQFQYQHMQQLHNQRMAALANHRNEFERNNARRLVARGLESDGPSDNNDDIAEYEDTVDSVQVRRPSPLMRRHLQSRGVRRLDSGYEDDTKVMVPAENGMDDVSMMTRPSEDDVGSMFFNSSRLDYVSQEDDMLQCPKCVREFPSQKHNEFLEHIDSCCA